MSGYCSSCKMMVQEKYLIKGKCPMCGKPIVIEQLKLAKRKTIKYDILVVYLDKTTKQECSVTYTDVSAYNYQRIEQAKNVVSITKLNREV